MWPKHYISHGYVSLCSVERNNNKKSTSGKGGREEDIQFSGGVVIEILEPKSPAYGVTYDVFAQ